MTYKADDIRIRSLNGLKTIWTGRPQDPVWERPALLIILALNAALNFWNLGINGWGNAYYGAAVQAGSMDWKAYFFGSLDWGNSTTVDKPPLSLWIMGLSVRLFGLSPESMMAPQAAMGVLTTFLIYALLRKNFSAAAAIGAAAVFFTSPIITLLSRYNNPDPLMLLLMVAAAYLVVRAVESSRLRPIVWAGVFLGLAFMTKQLQALLCVPALGIAFFSASQLPMWRRLGACLACLAAMLASGAVWMIFVELIPPSARPFVGGSPSNSVIQLTLGYNGIDRVISAQEDPTIQLVPERFRSEESDAGFLRLFNGNFAQEASWLLIITLFACLAIAIKWRKLMAKPGQLAAAIASTGWFLTTYSLLSFMGNGIHTYYAATMVPPMALVIGVAVDALTSSRITAPLRVYISVTGIIGAAFAAGILNSGSGWPEFLAPGILIAACIGAALIAIKPPLELIDRAAVSLLVLALLAPPALVSVYNVATPHGGSNPLSGPTTKSKVTMSHYLAGASEGEPLWAQELVYGLDPGPALVAHLSEPSTCRWAAATYPGQTAAKYQLATSKPIMALSGFMGVDPSPTLQQFRSEVEAGHICFLVWQQSHLDVPARSSTLNEISDWVKTTFPSEVVDGATVYDLRSSQANIEGK
ncbi:glycosyltransferase family 39 protein [Arthrobacter sp. ISL-5]|uniref:glycosyltransferase family 39 protein n=1 Tax=Arthrobacter sp. ISL-5 TaxID=2819111 RepID=UPI001BE638D2|nr:glycosyltransferase family 39 protein [Arthrobacter sp. ISL-5]MBT2554998.1 glycosyltransferase family 39 protein [Arthrobacter sp. ISL-5]